jgi:hypothetical protein
MGNAIDLYSIGAWSEYRPEHRLSSLSFSSVPPFKRQDRPRLGHDLLPSQSFPIHHPSNVSTLYSLATDSAVMYTTFMPLYSVPINSTKSTALSFDAVHV